MNDWPSEPVGVQMSRTSQAKSSWLWRWQHVCWSSPCSEALGSWGGVERILLLQMIKGSHGYRLWKKERFSWERSLDCPLHCVIMTASRGESRRGQARDSFTALSEIEWDKLIPRDSLILSKLYLLSSQLWEHWSLSEGDRGGWTCRLRSHLPSEYSKWIG